MLDRIIECDCSGGPLAKRGGLRDDQTPTKEPRQRFFARAFTLRLNHRLRHLNKGMPSVRSIMSCLMIGDSNLFPVTLSMMAAISRSPSRLEILSAVT